MGLCVVGSTGGSPCIQQFNNRGKYWAGSAWLGKLGLRSSGPNVLRGASECLESTI